MQEIIPGLYLGSVFANKESKLSQLLKAGITHVVCTRHEKETASKSGNFPENFEYLVVNYLDGNIIPVFPKVNSFIEKCFRSGGKVLVHGNVGVSCSAALVMAYLMENKALSYNDAYSLIVSKRHSVQITTDCVNQLKEYEPIYQARSTYSRGHTSKLSDDQGKLKRRYDEIIDSDANNRMEVCEETQA